MQSIFKNERTISLVSFLGALSLFLSAIEYIIRKPVPFFRIGLANLSVLLALRLLSPGATIFLVLIKVIGQGLIQGTLFSYVFLFSVTGSFSSILVMIFLYLLLKNRVSLIGISIAGALTSNMVQIFMARIFVFGKSAWLIAPPFIAVGLVSGFLLGMFAETFWNKSEWVKQVIRETGNGS